MNCAGSDFRKLRYLHSTDTLSKALDSHEFLFTGNEWPLRPQRKNTFGKTATTIQKQKQDILHFLETRFSTKSTIFRLFWNLSPECFSVFSIFQKAPSSCPVNSLQTTCHSSQAQFNFQSRTVHKPELLRIQFPAQTQTPLQYLSMCGPIQRRRLQTTLSAL